MWNFQGSLFLVLEFPRDLTQFCLSFVLSGISRGKVKKKKKKIPGGGGGVYPQPPVWIFSAIAHFRGRKIEPR